MDQLVKFLQEEDGVTAIEYALIAATIAVFIIGILQATGGALERTFQAIIDVLPT
ncbi:MAG: Flp family type IVb pilin [bacterium]